MKLIKFSAVLGLLAFSLFAAPTASAQIEIGVKISPSIVYQRPTAPQSDNAKSEGASLGIGFGVIADYFFGTNYAFNSGVLFNMKGGEISYTENSSLNNPKTENKDISLHYIEIPLAIKLFTNEVAPDVRAYFNGGVSLNTLVGARIGGEKVDPAGDKFTKQFNLFEIGAIIGAGAEMQMGQSTKAFGGLSYQHGLTDVNDKIGGDNTKIELKNSVFALDFGIKF